MELTDTELLDWLIANSSTWNPRMQTGTRERGYRMSGGYWDDGCANYGGGGDQITPEAEDDNPRTAIRLAIEKERRERRVTEAIAEGLISTP